MSAPSGVHAEALPQREGGGYYVFWQTASGYGSQGIDLTREAAEALAERLRSGEIRLGAEGQ